MTSPKAPVDKSGNAETIKAEALGEVLNLTPRRIRMLAAEGVIPRSARGKYPLLEAVRAYVEYLQLRAEGRGTESIDVAVERARLLKARADEAELNNRAKAGEYVSVHEVAGLFAKLASETKMRMMAIPTVIAPRIIGLKNIRQVKAAVEEVIRDGLNELADDRAVIPGSDKAAGGSKSKQVGRRKPPAKSRGKRRAG